MNQTLKVIPQGLIESGSVTINADPITGLVTYQGSVEAGVGWFSKTFSDQGSLKLDHTMMLSSNIKVGAKFAFDNVNIEIASMGKDTALANISITKDSDELKGLAELDLSQIYFSFKHVILSGVAVGENITLELTSDNK